MVGIPTLSEVRANTLRRVRGLCMALERSNATPARFIEVFRAAALQAGAVARRLQGDIRPRSKEGHSPESEALSAADLASQDVLLLRLADAFPHAAVDAEEDTRTVRLFPPPAPEQPVIVVDPIDGSLNYLRGTRAYAVMAAWIAEGQYLASVVYFPAWRIMYWAEAHKGCYRQHDGGAPEPAAWTHLPRRILVPPRTPQAARRRLKALGYDVKVSRCSAVDSAAPALGKAVGSAGLLAPDRRRAIGFLLAREAGGSVVFPDGPWHLEDPEAGERKLGAHAVGDSEERARHILSAALG